MKIDLNFMNISPDILFTIGGFRIANSTTATILVLLFIIILAIFISSTFKTKPGRVQLFIESIYEMVANLINSIITEKKRAEALLPIIGSIFVYLLIANLFEVIPFIPHFVVGDHESHTLLFRQPTTDVNTTLGLALAAVLAINVVGVKEWGLFGYLNNFIKVKAIYHGMKKGIGDFLIAVIEFFVGLLEIIGELTKVISLGLRLFGNMFAGNVLMVVFFSFIAWVLPSILVAVNIFIAILQAVVFAALVAGYYMLALKTEDMEEAAVEHEATGRVK